MGNSPSSSSSLRLSNGDHPYRVQLGNSVALDFKGRQKGEQEGSEMWMVSYTVDNSTCRVALTKCITDIKSSPHNHVLCISTWDPGVLASDLNAVVWKRDESGLLEYRHSSSGPGCTVDPRSTIVSKHTTTTNALGATKTRFDLYGHGKRWCLLVSEWKTTSKDEKPYTGTMAHYYANAENGKDVGISVVVKRIRVSQDGHLDFAVDGPEQHPVDALFYMFDEVQRTGTWKPTYCPHCANNIIQRQRAGMFSQSESEDSDIDYVPAALPRGRRQTSGSIVANDGRFRGNYNGNLNIRNLILGRRGR